MQQGTPVARLRRESWNKVHNSLQCIYLNIGLKFLVIRLGTRVLKDEPILNKFFWFEAGLTSVIE